MTREEAIMELHNCIELIRQDGQDYLDARDIPLLDMAIEALKMADSLERLHEIVHEQEEIVKILDEERPKGNWDFAGDNMFRCTECGVLYTYKQLEHLKKHTTDSTFPNFCPRCGADMRGERNE